MRFREYLVLAVASSLIGCSSIRQDYPSLESSRISEEFPVEDEYELYELRNPFFSTFTPRIFSTGETIKLPKTRLEKKTE